MKKRSLILIALVILVVFIMGASYAWLQLTLHGKKTNKITVGNLELLIKNESEGILLEDASPLPDDEAATSTGYQFSLENTGDIPSQYTIYLDDILDTDQDGSDDFTEDKRMSDQYVKYSIEKDGVKKSGVLTEIGVNPNRILDQGVINPGKINNYVLRVWIDYDADNRVMGTIFATKLRIVGTQTNIEDPEIIKNPNIKAVYQYDNDPSSASYCITGAEKCQGITPTTYDSGTLVKYAVTNSDEKMFQVLHDDGETLTLIQSDNTVDNKLWYDQDSINNQGPTTALAALKEATSGWTNVKDQTYNFGQTKIYNNEFTGCVDYGNCNSNVYQLTNQVLKARMITVPEAVALGCRDANTTCPNWLYSGLSETNPGYWTMSADVNSTKVWNIGQNGNLTTNEVSTNNIGVRAVIVIDK